MTRLFLVSCLSIVIAAPAAGQTRTGDLDDLARRVQKFEDKEEIRNLLLDYGRHLDNRDFAAYSRLFARDGEWVGGFGSVSGPANIQAFMEKNMGTGPNRGKNYHLLSNFAITVNGDTATAWSRWAFVVPGERGAVISQAGDTMTRSCVKTATGGSSAASLPMTRLRRFKNDTGCDFQENHTRCL